MKKLKFIKKIRRRRKFWQSSIGLRYTPVIKIDTKYGNIRFFCMGQKTLKRINRFFEKEPETLEWIDGFSENSVFFDIGANVGQFSLYASFKPGVKVLSFEPAIKDMFILIKNLEINKKDEIVDPYCFAFNNITELGALRMPTTLLGKAGAQFLTDNKKENFNFYSKKANVPIFRQTTIAYAIDDFIKLFNVSFPTYIKIDVDGNEVDIIKGAIKTLKDDRLKSVLIEINPTSKDDLDNISSVMESCGLKLRKKGVTQASKSVNHIFFR